MLVALDAATGALRWSMGQHVADARALEDVTVGGGPVTADGLVVFVGVRFLKRWEARLVALDARTGRLVWQRTVVTSQQELNLFGEPVKEMWAGTPAIADGTVYAPTGLGVFVAADLRDGTVRWISSYDTLPIERVDLWYRRQSASRGGARPPPSCAATSCSRRPPSRSTSSASTAATAALPGAGPPSRTAGRGSITSWAWRPAAARASRS